MTSTFKRPVLQSDFALNQLTGIAWTLPEHDFVLLFQPIFGDGIAVDIYQNMWLALREGQLENPEYHVFEGDERQRTVVYDDDELTLLVRQGAIEQAISEPHTSPDLLLALVGGFGQYLASLIQFEWHHLGGTEAPVLTAEQARQTGARYASLMTFVDGSAKQDMIFGHYIRDGHKAPLALDMSEAPALEKNFQEPPQKIVIQPRFAAGADGHEAIEQVLEDVGFSPFECKAIYFGNWLRDYSQLVDPKIVRPVGAPKQFPRKFSRKALTLIVDVLADKPFQSLRASDAEYYRVTERLLGVYRASEHIDNPTNHDANVQNPKEIDEWFDTPVLPGDIATQVHPEKSMKRYINAPYEYMLGKLGDAIKHGKTPRGMRYFGEALHVLEDYFAHSNFVELSLRKQGHDVLPWTTQAECKHGFPVVTGLFSGSDIFASIAEPLGKLLFPKEVPIYQHLVPGYRSTAERILAIILDELENPLWGNTLKTLLKLRDQVAANPLFRYVNLAVWVLTLPLKLIAYYCSEVFQSLFQWLGDRVGHEQSRWSGNPNEEKHTDATHSQLAKDHDSHPLHDLATKLARHAVTVVGEGMLRFWNEETDTLPIELAAQFIRHPYDTDWQDELVKEWAAANTHNVTAATSIENLQRLHNEHLSSHFDKLKGMGQTSR
ncbi:HET-C-related protein [Pseudomonas sp. UFMG81]|uniref:HET-C-related protein n=1 Tax=Pseudomonas sp. UFMG81 TaxID=2745936 RepID=UPI00188F460B|nr:HET-C-related protein [Pseudomonas sp. UFMG81]